MSDTETKAFLESWRPAGYVEEGVEVSSESLKAAIERLDGKETTLLTLEKGDSSLYIAGGGSGGLSVSLHVPGSDQRELVGAPDVAGERAIVGGGQQYDWPARLLVGPGQASAVAIDFASDVDLASRGPWETLSSS